MNRYPRRHRAAASVVVLGLLAIAGNASGQAWVPSRGQGAVTLSFQRIHNTGHRLSNGYEFKVAASVNLSAYLETDYALTDRFSFSLGVPYVMSKYTDPNKPPLILPYVPGDQCHCWQTGFQDFGATARYNLIRAREGKFSLTPSATLGTPTHDYVYRGESALGRNLIEGAIAVDVGQRLDKISPNLSVEGRYSYAMVERVLDISTNRSNLQAQTTYLLWKRRLALRGFASWQWTHGGIRFGNPTMPGPFEVNTPEKLDQHDRIMRDDFLHAGAGFSYAFPRMDVFGYYISYVNGTQTHMGDAATIGISWPFELHRAAP
jgi:hypothetical protein